MRRAFIASLLALVAACGNRSPESAPPKDDAAPPVQVPPSVTAMDEVETRSRYLVDELQDFGQRARLGRVDDAVAGLFAASVTGTPFPQPSDARAAVDAGAGTAVRTWLVPSSHKQLAPETLASSLRSLLLHFDEVSDIRAELVDSELAEEGLRARVRLSLRGRAVDGQREVVHIAARVRAAAVKEPGPEHTEESSVRVEEFAITAVTSTAATRELFSEVSARAGVAHELMRPRRDPLFAMGAAVADVDNDGDVDLLVAAQDELMLYRNEGNGTFVRMPDETGVTMGVEDQLATAPLFLDYDNDGDMDLFVAQYAVGHFLFENRLVPDGALGFRDVSAAAGVKVPAFPYSVTAGDVNGDGRTDIFVAGYGPLDQAAPTASNGAPNQLWLNNGDGTFADVAEAWGVRGASWTFAAQLADLDGDADLDLVVANHWGVGIEVYRNGGGRFEREPSALGMSMRGTVMGLAVGDLTGDGHIDVFASGLHTAAGERVLGRLDAAEVPWIARARERISGGALFAGDGAGGFSRVAGAAAPPDAGWVWGGAVVDLDGDGRLDVWQPNGWFEDGYLEDLASPWWRLLISRTIGEPGTQVEATVVTERDADDHRQFEDLAVVWNQRDRIALQSDGAFVDVSAVSGADSPGDARGAVFADFDNDGDADLFVRSGTLHELHRLFRNETGAGGGFVRVAVRGAASGRDAFGAVVRAKTAAGELVRVVLASASDRRLVFPLGGAKQADWIEVKWPSGTVQRFGAVAAGKTVVLEEGVAAPVVVKARSFQLPAPPTEVEKRWQHTSLRKGARVPRTEIENRAGETELLAPRLVRKRGEHTLLYFFSMDCAPCKDELPALQKLHEKTKSSKVAVLGMAMDHPSTLGALPEFLSGVGATFDVIVFPRREAARFFNHRQIDVPMSVLVDHRGFAVDVFFGSTPKHIAWFESLAKGRRR